MRKHPITLAALALATFSIGFLSREITMGSQAGTEQHPPRLHAAENHRLSALNSPLNEPGSPRPEGGLAKFESSEGIQRWLRLIEVLEGASLDELPGIAAAIRDYKEVQLVGRRWLELDANDLYQSALVELEREQGGERARFDHSDFLQFLGEEWPEHDLEGGIAALLQSTEAPPYDDLWELRQAFLDKLNQLDARRAFEFAKLWDGDGPGSDSKALREWVASDPHGAIAAVLEYSPVRTNRDFPPADDLFTYTGNPLMPIAEIWADIDPAEALACAAELPESQGRLLRKGVFDRWAALDAEAATEWLQQQDDPEIRERHRRTLIEAWGKEDPRAALIWCQENLEDQELHLARLDLFRGAAGSVDPAFVAELVKEVVPEDSRTSYDETIAKQWFPSTVYREAGWEAPGAAVDWLHGIEEPQARAHTLGHIERIWRENDPEGLQAFFSDPRNAGLPSSSHHHLTESLAEQDPLHALEWAAGLGGGLSVDVSRIAYESWLGHRSSEAAEWFARLPSNDARHTALLRATLRHACEHPQDQTILTTLPQVDRVQALEELETLGIPGESSQRLRALLNE